MTKQCAWSHTQAGPCLLYHVPHHFKARGMCERAVEKSLWVLKFVPDWFVVPQEMWYEDFNDNDEIIE